MRGGCRGGGALLGFQHGQRPTAGRHAHSSPWQLSSAFLSRPSAFCPLHPPQARRNMELRVWRKRRPEAERSFFQVSWASPTAGRPGGNFSVFGPKFTTQWPSSMSPHRATPSPFLKSRAEDAPPRPPDPHLPSENQCFCVAPNAPSVAT